MSGQQYLFYLVLCVSAYIILRIIIGVIKMLFQDSKMLRIYEKETNIFTAKAMLKCKFLKGLDQLFPNTNYQICADEINLTIIDLQNPMKKFVLEYSKIIEFRYSKDIKYSKEIYEYLTVIFQSDSGSQNLKFQLSPLFGFPRYNKIAMEQSNIFDYVNQFISKKVETIIL